MQKHDQPKKFSGICGRKTEIPVTHIHIPIELTDENSHSSMTGLHVPVCKNLICTGVDTHVHAQFCMKRLNTMNLYKIQSNLLCTRVILPLFGFRFLWCCLMPSVWPRLANVVLLLGILNLTWPVGFNSLWEISFHVVASLQKTFTGGSLNAITDEQFTFICKLLLCCVLSLRMPSTSSRYVWHDNFNTSISSSYCCLYSELFFPLIFCEVYPTPHSV